MIMTGKSGRIRGLILLLILLAGIVTACGTRESVDIGSAGVESTAAQVEKEKFKLYTWYGGKDKEITDRAVANTLKQVPGVEVEIEPRTDSEKIKLYFATGEIPECFDAWAAILDLAIEMNAVQVLDELIEDSNLRELYSASALEKLVYKGHVYSIRNDGAAYVFLYYNKAVFRKYGVKPPESIDELKEAIRTFKKNKIVPLALFGKEGWPGRQLYDSILTREYPDGLNALIPAVGEPAVTVEAPRFKQAADVLYDLVKEGLLSEGAFSTPYDKAFELFAGGQAAMFQNGIWDLDHVCEVLKEDAGILWYPYADRETVQKARYNLSGGFEPGKGMALKPNASELQTRFFFVLNEELAKAKVMMRGDVTTPIDLEKYPEIKYEKEYTPLQKEVLSHISSVRSETSMSFVIDRTQVLEEAVSELLTGEVAPEDFIRKIRNGFDSLEDQK